MPQNQSGTNGRNAVYPWADMVSGDSFFIEGIDSKKASSICTSGRIYFHKRKRINVSFHYRILKEKGIKGARVWFKEKV